MVDLQRIGFIEFEYAASTSTNVLKSRQLRPSFTWLRVRAEKFYVFNIVANWEAPLPTDCKSKLGYRSLRYVISFRGFLGIDGVRGRRKDREQRDILVFLCYDGGDGWVRRLLAGNGGRSGDSRILDHARRNLAFYNYNCQNRAADF